ncbi:unnamed protein product [Rotaria sordida]|uniref:Transient receptor ion channel domain-containing protein n=1 Tax=Rotaria sordida TaxID=392033 RepID=A0A815V1W6_9BILA|nr:unnamed protein product [Rotaria sordida]CAF1526862.1 unnamed protein product [Rotaria sordida]
MSRAIQRLMKDYRKAEKLIGRSTNESFADFTNSASFTTQTMTQIRREPELTQDEKKYLVAVERGDMATTRRYLAISSGTTAALLDVDMPMTPININCLDPLGRSALSIAIEYENIEMIELLLSYNVDTGEALLHAIDEEFVEAVELLLQHEDLKQQQQKNSINADNNRYSNNIGINDKSNPLFTLAQDALEKEKKEQQYDITQKNSKSKWSFLLQAVRKKEQQQSVNEQLNLSTSRLYTPDITPVVLAAHRDNYEILKILLERGEKVTEPHDVRCDCANCIVYNKEDSLRHSRSRINAYKALSSPCYISLSSRDPIMTAFDLNRELKRLSRIENEFKQEYEQLAQQCQEYSAALLAETRSSKELEIILNYDSENPPVLSETPEKMNLSRLKLAIRYKQKKFVSHAHCQQLLASLWYEGLPGFRRRHSVIKILITTLVGLLFPVLSIAYLLMPRSSIGRIMRQPFIKFICHSVSYIFFLILLFVVSLRIDFAKVLSGIEEETNERRGPPPNPVEIAIMFYVAGFIWAEIKQLYQEGLHQYMADTWNLLDWVTNCLYVAAIVLRVMAYIKVNQEERDLQNKSISVHGSHNSSGVHTPNHPNLTADPVSISTGHNVRRRDWNAWDPTLISEGIFAAANIFSSLKLVYIFTINPHLGPLQISLGRMVHDILKFSVLILLVAFAFACGLNQLFWYYARMKKSECELDAGFDEYCAKDIHKHFSNLFESLQTLFWGTFGLIDLQTFQIYKKHTFTMFIGLLMYGVYSSIMIIVLLNMLIAMMSNSYQYIANSTETEWKFARAKLWISYFEDGCTLPPPFNIVPSPKSICYGFVYIYSRIFGCSKSHLRNRWQSIKKILSKINEREIKYQTVIRELVKRYIMKRQQKDQTEGVTEDDLNEIKQDISAFRFELLEILSTNGFKVQSMKKNPDTGKFEPVEETIRSARVGRKRGKMNLEKTINKNMFDMSTSIRDKNPLETTDLMKNDQCDTISIPPSSSSSILSNPKQKLTAQFKRAITMIKQRSEPTRESSPLQFQTSISLMEKPTNSFDTSLLTSLIEETTNDNNILSSQEILTSKSQSFVQIKPTIIRSSSNQDTDSSSTTAATVIAFDQTTCSNHHNQNTSSYIIKSNSQKIQSPTIQTINQQFTTPQILSSSSSATLSPTPISSTSATGYFRSLLDGRAPMASPDPLSVTSDESCNTPDLDIL